MYPMMVSIEEAQQIYSKRGSDYRKKKGYRPVQDPVSDPTHLTKQQIIEAVTLVKLKEEIIK